VSEQTIYAYDGHDGYACPICGGKAVDVDFDAQPELACPCFCHEQDQPLRYEEESAMDEQPQVLAQREWWTKARVRILEDVSTGAIEP
jgi:hypothetical protein